MTFDFHHEYVFAEGQQGNVVTYVLASQVVFYFEL